MKPACDVARLPLSALAVAAWIVLQVSPASAATLAEMAKESGCASKPVMVEGTTHLYRCITQSGFTSYFNVSTGTPIPPAERSTARASAAPTPPGFPKVDASTQKGRDDVRRKVLSEELAAEEKLLAESRTAYAEGAPSALPEEKSDVEKYRSRIARLRLAVSVHEKNVEALRKELAAVK